MKRLTLLLLLISVFSLKVESQKSQSSKPNNSKKAPNEKKSDLNIISIECEYFADNGQSLIGKAVSMGVYYEDSENQKMSLRDGEYDSYETILSSYHGFNEKNDKFNTRKVHCPDGNIFYIRIPKVKHAEFPNLKYGYITIYGYVINKKTILALAVER
jgi:hypothetical protein